MTTEESSANYFFEEAMHYIALATVWTVGQERHEREAQRDALDAVHAAFIDQTPSPSRENGHPFYRSLENLAHSYPNPIASLLIGKHLKRLVAGETARSNEEKKYRSLEDSLHLVRTGLEVLRQPSKDQQEWYRKHSGLLHTRRS